MKMPSHIQPQNRNRIFRIYSKPKKSFSLHSFMYIVSAKFKNFFVAPDALQQSKSGPRPEKVRNHWCMQSNYRLPLAISKYVYVDQYCPQISQLQMVDNTAPSAFA